METIKQCPSNPFMDLARTVVLEERCLTALSVQMFVTRTHFDVDLLFVDEQWSMMNTQRSDDLNVLTPEMIQRLNFSTISKLIKKLSVLFPSSSTAEYNGDGKNVVITTKILTGCDGSVNFHGGRRHYKEIKMTKNAYKELIMESQTESARQVRKYYICLEDLFTQYLLYQRAHEMVLSTHRMEILSLENRELSNKLDDVVAVSKSQSQQLNMQSQKLDMQSQQLNMQSQKLDMQSQQLNIQSEKLDMLSKILYKETDNKVVDVTEKSKKQALVILQNKNERTNLEIVRGQINHVNQVKRKRNDMEVIGTIDSYKNPIDILNRFDESIKQEGDNHFQKQNNKSF